MSLVFPIIASALVPLVARYFQTRRYGFFLPHVSAHLFTMLPLVLIVLSFVFGVPTPLLTCSLESRWQHLFRIKDDRAIRAIQDTLRCCGLNSIRDRAWPFPSNGVDARACETTQGWNIRCLDPWRRQEATAAGMVGLANLSTWTLVVTHSTCTQRDYVADHCRFYLLMSPTYGKRGCNCPDLECSVAISTPDYWEDLRVVTERSMKSQVIVMDKRTLMLPKARMALRKKRGHDQTRNAATPGEFQSIERSDHRSALRHSLIAGFRHRLPA